jgi:hypothetical protein
LCGQLSKRRINKLEVAELVLFSPALFVVMLAGAVGW